MSTKSRRHTHKYYRVAMYGTNVWACGEPDCLHYMPKHMEKMVNGKATLCWQCGNTTIMTPASMMENQPRCDDCRIGEVELPLSEILKKRLQAENGLEPTVGSSPTSRAAIEEFLKGK